MCHLSRSSSTAKDNSARSLPSSRASPGLVAGYPSGHRCSNASWHARSSGHFLPTCAGLSGPGHSRSRTSLYHAHTRLTSDLSSWASGHRSLASLHSSRVLASASRAPCHLLVTLRLLCWLRGSTNANSLDELGGIEQVLRIGNLHRLRKLVKRSPVGLMCSSNLCSITASLVAGRVGRLGRGWSLDLADNFDVILARRVLVLCSTRIGRWFLLWNVGVATFSRVLRRKQSSIPVLHAVLAHAIAASCRDAGVEHGSEQVPCSNRLAREDVVTSDSILEDALFLLGPGHVGCRDVLLPPSFLQLLARLPRAIEGRLARLSWLQRILPGLAPGLARNALLPGSWHCKLDLE
mmetsp:Transcript_41407/g.64661  ORF Transcript_41407/g.64661 Transcript_41407/m.64661 type:complete len:350 (-) Transcript_41407:356-1405(-)